LALISVKNAVLATWEEEHRLVFFIYTDELSFNEGVVGLIDVVQALEVVEYCLDFLEVFGFLPQVLLWVLETLSFNLLDLVHSVLLHFSPA
jgi:hypothetical protein